ncbi:MAG: hypothetical protein Q7S74_04535 [Nanoarchaeota archaeon]|nr:hypothetical protein [Nanoarchaeota archaeon]
MKKSVWIIIGIIVLAGVAGAFYWKNNTSVNNDGKYDSFAQCLTEKGVKMYGAWWCSHCQNQKKAFGSSWKYATYVECSTPDGNSQLPVCKDAGIEGYPTWDFGGGVRLSGEVSFDELSQRSGCPLLS